MDKVLSLYPAEVRRGTLVPLGNAGGFSGARLWRLNCELGAFCLRAWASGMSVERLSVLHRWMKSAADAGLDYIPRIIPTSDAATFVKCDNWLWEITTWMSGSADYRANPKPNRLEAACRALARLHETWKNVDRAWGLCPAVKRRLDRAADWIKWAGSASDPPAQFSGADFLHNQVDRAWHTVQTRIGQTPATLAPWRDRPMPLQPCLGDIWHDHVLFTGDLVTGIIDFGSARMDHITVDLARLLGSLAENDMAMRGRGFDAYRSVRPLSHAEEVFAAVLDETGMVIGLANWLMWLCRDNRLFEDYSAVARRLDTLLRRFD